MISKSISCELFDLQYQVSDIAIDHICDELIKHGCLVNHYVNYDASIIIYFNRNELNGELRIDRINRQFDIVIGCDDEIIMPVSGDWSLIDEYLRKALTS